ncbi:hypothetical protein CCAX7_17400 [Capsulimonas corticalis]|uniref:Uncharacterized protein n=1 Tax=Capsulimonas corticalis TaxID=2219043 RepID=A0A402D416_9BACT|nr:hypothetical protein [Capsulimonas corticalis]BDI29689.1 hypothetical protein CCAX7_17400 [Capsulimonas corticalis]
MSLMLLDHSSGSIPVLDLSPSGMLLGALLVLAVAALTVAAANALTRKSPAAGASRPGDPNDDVWPPPPKR